MGEWVWSQCPRGSNRVCTHSIAAYIRVSVELVADDTRMHLRSPWRTTSSPPPSTAHANVTLVLEVSGEAPQKE